MYQNEVEIGGGHTIHSQVLQIGFSVIGRRLQSLTMPNVIEGDYLILTKPIGTGLMSNSLTFVRTKSPTQINYTLD